MDNCKRGEKSRPSVCVCFVSRWPAIRTLARNQLLGHRSCLVAKCLVIRPPSGWGAPRIHGELLKLGIHIAETSVSKYMLRSHKPPSQTWRTFLENHAHQLVSIHFLTFPTIRFQVLYVFLVLAHDRRLLHSNQPATRRRSGRDVRTGRRLHHSQTFGHGIAKNRLPAKQALRIDPSR